MVRGAGAACDGYHCRAVGRFDGGTPLKGRPVGMADGLIAATAMEHGLTVVTRNIKDFSGLGIQVVNPWEAG